VAEPDTSELEDTADVAGAPAPEDTEGTDDISEPTGLPPGERWGEPVLPAPVVNEPVEPDGGTDYVEEVEEEEDLS